MKNRQTKRDRKRQRVRWRERERERDRKRQRVIWRERERERERERMIEFKFSAFISGGWFRSKRRPRCGKEGKADSKKENSNCFQVRTHSLKFSFFSLSVCPSVCLSVCLSVYLSICLSFSLSVSHSFSFFLSLFLRFVNFEVKNV